MAGACSRPRPSKACYFMAAGSKSRQGTFDHAKNGMHLAGNAILLAYSSSDNSVLAIAKKDNVRAERRLSRGSKRLTEEGQQREMGTIILEPIALS